MGEHGFYWSGKQVYRHVGAILYNVAETPKIRLVTQKRVLNAHAEMAVTPHIGKVVY